MGHEISTFEGRGGPQNYFGSLSDPTLLRGNIGSHVFRFEDMHLNNENFLSPAWWRETETRGATVLTFTAKLRHCRKRIREWSNHSFYDFMKVKSDLMQEIQRINGVEEHIVLSKELIVRREDHKGRLLG